MRQEPIPVVIHKKPSLGKEIQDWTCAIGCCLPVVLIAAGAAINGILELFK